MNESLKTTLNTAAALPFWIAFGLGGPITYIILAVDTWTSSGPAWVKILINLTIDAFLSAIWPITWAIWLLTELFGSESALSRVFT